MEEVEITFFSWQQNVEEITATGHVGIVHYGHLLKKNTCKISLFQKQKSLTKGAFTFFFFYPATFCCSCVRARIN